MQVLSDARRLTRILKPQFLLNSVPSDHKSSLLHVKASTLPPRSPSLPQAVKKIYFIIIDSVNVRKTMAPNAWLWSLIENCRTSEDIMLLFDALHNFRRFRLSNLRIHDNFNCNLCREVTKACAGVGTVDFGKKALWNHNVYGLTPSIASANHLLSYAKHHNDVKLMVEV